MFVSKGTNISIETTLVGERGRAFAKWFVCLWENPVTYVKTDISCLGGP